ncbi:MAG TPA: dihydroorotate dehydrogenase electron transfer subunit [Planctomycetota bacterium]
MAFLPADSRCFDATVAARRPCGPDALVMEVRLPEPLAPLAPGRFAMLSPPGWAGPIIPRPFSVYDQLAPDQLSFLIQVIGAGTKALAALDPGSGITCTVPLGNGFAVQPSERKVVLVAGGVGSAPFLLYARQRLEQDAGANTCYYFGARTADRLYDREVFEALGLDTRCATDDGSLGFPGNVIQMLARDLRAGAVDRAARFAACGPEGLLHAFADFAREHGLDCELSLETYMGCGYGVCNACPTPTNPDGPLGDWPYAKTCLDGPIFDLAAIDF